MALLPKVKLKALVTFPGNVIGGVGIETTKEGGAVTVDMAWNEFGTQTFLPSSPTNNVLTYDTVTGNYVMIPSSLLGGGSSGGTRDKLIANRTYYVRTDGSDSNNGLANTAGGAFLTLQKVVNVCKTLDFAGFSVVANIADGTYAGAVLLDIALLGGLLFFVGNVTTPSNVVLTNPGHLITVSGFGSKLYIKGVKTVTTSNGYHLYCIGGGSILVDGKIEFGTAGTGFHCAAVTQGVVQISAAAASYAISGAATYHFYAATGGQVTCNSVTCNITGAPAFSIFANAVTTGAIESSAVTWSGAVTATKKFNSATAGGINTYGSGIDYFPGATPGTTTAPGWYS